MNRVGTIQGTKRTPTGRVVLVPEWHTHSSMKKRCHNPNDAKYASYGGRGIKVCDRWLGNFGFTNFMNDMGSKPTPLHTIDRIDNNGNYEPSNCRWATRSEQNKNTSKSHHIDISGVELNFSDWCEIFNIKMTNVFNRTRDGWDIIEAITTPVGAAGYRSQRRNR